jgi:hypothetical protein
MWDGVVRLSCKQRPGTAVRAVGSLGEPEVVERPVSGIDCAQGQKGTRTGESDR